MNKTHYYSMIENPEGWRNISKTNENCDKKVFKDLIKPAAKFENCLLKEEQDFLTKFWFSTSTFTKVYQSS